jgi:hypothetical protein
VRIALFLAFIALAGCASQSQQSGDPASFDGQKMPKVGQTKQEVAAVWGKPDRTRLNSDGSSAELFVPDKWKFAAPFYGMAARVHALVVKYGPDSRVTSWQLNDNALVTSSKLERSSRPFTRRRKITAMCPMDRSESTVDASGVFRFWYRSMVLPLSTRMKSALILSIG